MSCKQKKAKKKLIKLILNSIKNSQGKFANPKINSDDTNLTFNDWVKLTGKPLKIMIAKNCVMIFLKFKKRNLKSPLLIYKMRLAILTRNRESALKKLSKKLTQDSLKYFPSFSEEEIGRESCRE